jgi:dTDP-4-dehydrorhamnose 3,5-epimerase
MKVTQTAIPDVLVIDPTVHRDGRGFFLEFFHAERYRNAGIGATFVQDNHSSSTVGVLRGLHGQKNRPQGKLVRVLEGAIFDVAVDLRKDSATFGKWVSAELSADNFRQIYIPPGLLHGFCVISETTQVEYKCTGHYDPEDEIGVLWNDAEIGINWPIKNPVLSEKDRGLPSFADLMASLTTEA